MNRDELKKIILDNEFKESPFNPESCVWSYPEAETPTINDRFRVYCALFLNKETNCLEDCTEIYDYEQKVFMLNKHLYICPIKKELDSLDGETLMNVINSQKEIYKKMMKIVKKIMVDEKINDLEKDFDNGKTKET